MGSAFVSCFNRVAALVRKWAPYLLLEVLLPGGTLFALMLFIYQQRHLLATEKAQPLHVVVAQASFTPKPKLELVACGCAPARAACCVAAANDSDVCFRRAA